MNRTKVVLFDADGVVLVGKRFSYHLQQEFGISPDVINRFFNNEFKKCLIGKADLRVELHKYLPMWRWTSGVDELLRYWFEKEHVVDQKIIDWVHVLKEKNIQCVLATNQEKYRLQYMRENMQFKYVFDHVFASCELGVIKPHMAFFTKIHNRCLPVERSEMILWDDDDKNVEGAQKYGLEAFRYDNSAQFEQWAKMII